jgi:hypothetical protein
MAAPSSTTRATPAGIKLDDGYSTKIAFARDSNVSFWEKTLSPPGLDGGDPIDTTTMHNADWRTMSARQLATLSEFTCTAAYDPNVYNDIINNLLNQEGSITVHFPDGSKLDFFGYLRSFQPQDVAEGAQPEAQITIVPTNYDPTNNVEASPVLTQVAGT